ncbi:modification methylase HaeIII [Lentilactobacillus sunkii]|uniref:DNA (cytosine-5-)-methyltransferase n=1 Tax=Lentilactobacillus sunkii TaxID=481719 RepID=A0A1E7XHX1_9LACO|nr:DNA cytosine methyltransferase [Lentilactobacillus sunkii]OFA12710.1 modification methylase HaeIII [Lentilactobacillus sunkii]
MKNKRKNLKSYVSLFSSSGVGDYGFYKAGFSLVASNELLERRMNVQRYNALSKDPKTYITGDIQLNKTKEAIYSRIDAWITKHNKDGLDLLVATPPCQGISVANHYKKDSDLNRNSLVLQSIIIAENTEPKIIVFENINRFLTTACTDTNGKTYEINTVIYNHLQSKYNILGKEINFKDYGANSSRPRTLVIALRKDIFPNVSPIKLFPDRVAPKTLRDVIGDLEPLKKMGEISDSDILHEFKAYRSDMRAWIHDLKQGENAFDNKDPMKRPHHMIGGRFIPNVNKNGDKYKRQIWDKVAPAVHTRNDILASQNTVHPVDDRVFSIRELMRMMNVPSEFRWSKESYDELNGMTHEKKRIWLKKNEINIRQSLGEAVPTIIFEQVGKKAGKLIDGLYTNEFIRD